MAFREAKRLQDRVQLDTLVRLRVLGPPNSRTTGLPATEVYDGPVWCLRKDSEGEIDIGGDRSTLTFPTSIITRYDPRWASLQGLRVFVYYPESPTRADTISVVEVIGRQRFLKMEVSA